ncbi:MAG: hypothetical protein IH859_09395 [Chloroflexi bacterium]|nr:hypothetical protein [Chloroflexota bacterium]
MEHPARLTVGELCDSVAHMNKDEPRLHPTVQVATDAQLRKALWYVIMWLREAMLEEPLAQALEDHVKEYGIDAPLQDVQPNEVP